MLEIPAEILQTPATSHSTLSFRSAGPLVTIATGHFRARDVREMENLRAEFQCAEFRSSLARNQDRLPLAARIPIEPEPVLPAITFPRSRSDKRAFACRPKHLRRETKRLSALANDESTAAAAPRCVQNRYAITLR